MPSRKSPPGPGDPPAPIPLGWRTSRSTARFFFVTWGPSTGLCRHHHATPLQAAHCRDQHNAGQRQFNPDHVDRTTRIIADEGELDVYDPESGPGLVWRHD